MLTVPSREKVGKYQELKSEVEELVGGINGAYATLSWTPVLYFYRSLPFENLIELYTTADIALLTPIRDGMNLVAKEFIASRTDKQGVLILSEMAGASKELGEAIIVNPTNVQSVSDAINSAITMDSKEQERTLGTMQSRLKRYDVHKWASLFMKTLSNIKKDEETISAKKVTAKVRDMIIEKYTRAQSKVFFLDYDGTLQRFFNDPKAAMPDKELNSLLGTIADGENCHLVLISGRDKDTIGQWFGSSGFTLIAEHGAWIKETGREWKERVPYSPDWKGEIIRFLESFVDRTPGSFLEEKSNSLAWHYRKTDVELGELRALELTADLTNLISNQDLEILEGNKVIEIKVTGINKGLAATEFLSGRNPEFIIAIGDDWTDEFLFKAMPDESVTIKVGNLNTSASFYVNDYMDVRELLASILKA